MAERAGLYLTDAQIAARLGVKVDEWRQNAALLKAHGLPKPNPMFGNRMYWPALKAFLDHMEGLQAPSLTPRDGVEKLEGEHV